MRPVVDEEEEGALAEEEEEVQELIEEGSPSKVEQPAPGSGQQPDADQRQNPPSSNQLLFPLLANTFGGIHAAGGNGCFVYGSRESINLLKDLIHNQVQPPPISEDGEYYKMGLKNAFETLSEYAQMFQSNGEDFLRHLFAEHVLKPAKVASLKRLVLKETGGGRTCTVRHRPGGSGGGLGNNELKRRRNHIVTQQAPILQSSVSVATPEEDVPSTVVKWPPDSSLSDISSD